jgi:hypothetical protein
MLFMEQDHYAPIALRIPWSRAVGDGGHPGMRTSTGMTLSTPPSEA